MEYNIYIPITARGKQTMEELYSVCLDQTRVTHVCALGDNHIVVGFSDLAFVQRFTTVLDRFSPWGERIHVDDSPIDSIVSVSQQQFAVLHTNGCVWIVSPDKRAKLSPNEDLQAQPFFINAYNDGFYLRLNNSNLSLVSSTEIKSAVDFNMNIKGCLTVFNRFVDYVFLTYDQHNNRVIVATIDNDENMALKGTPVELRMTVPSEYMCSSHLFDNFYTFVFCNVMYIIKCEYNAGEYNLSIECCSTFDVRVDVLRVFGLSGRYIVMLCQDRIGGYERFYKTLTYNTITRQLTPIIEVIFDAMDICPQGDSVFATSRENGKYYLSKLMVAGTDGATSQKPTPQKNVPTIGDMDAMLV